MPYFHIFNMQKKFYFSCLFAKKNRFAGILPTNLFLNQLRKQFRANFSAPKYQE